MLNTSNRIQILFWLVITVVPISPVAASLLETTQPIKLESAPILVKVGSITQVSAKSANYSDKLPIDGIAIRLQSEAKPEVYFRFLDDLNNWSDWQSANLFEEPFSNRWIATYNNELVDNSRQFEVKIEVANGIVEILEQGVFPVDTEIYQEDIAQPLEYQTDVPKPTIISRQEWGARSPNGSYNNMPYYDKLTIHHAAGYSANNLYEGKIQVKAIQELHMGGTRNWTDIAYHFLIDKAGNIYQGRPETVIGAHVMYYNTGNLGVCILGCYHPEETSYYCNDHLTQESRDAAVHLFAWLAEKFNYKDRVLLGHRDYYDYDHTSCPGNNIHKFLPEIREEIYTFRQLGGPPYEYTMSENYPNPFFASTNIVYDLPVESEVTVTIYNIKGETVIKLVDETQSKGSHSINWNGLDNRKNLSHTGVYFYHIATHQNVTFQLDEFYSETGKMLFLK